jgi:cytochrome P450
MATKRRPPGPSAAELRGKREAFVKRPTDFFAELQRNHGDVVWFNAGLRDYFLLSHPDDVRDVLLTQHRRFHKGPALEDGRALVGENLFNIEGETHRRHRRLIQPAFHWERIKAYGDVMVDEASRLRDALSDGEVRDVADDMAHVTLGVAVRTLFGSDMTDELRARITEHVRIVLRGWFGRTGARRTVADIPTFRDALASMNAIVDDLIHERRRDPGGRHDLLTMLLESRDETGAGLTDREVRDEVGALIAAGHETTSNALAWTWYLLSQNPEAEARMHRTIDERLGDRVPTAEDVEALEYLDQVFAESLRVIPAVWAIDRSVVEDHEVEGYVVPAGSVVYTSPYVTHHDPRWFPDPERFDPDRWTPEARKARPRYSYFPFGGGLRICIGQPFAELEATLILAVIGRRWRFRLEPDHPIELEPLITLRPKHGIRMRVEARS